MAEGAKVAVASRDAERIEAAAARIGALPIVFDSDDLDAVDGVVDTVERELGPVDVYVANTGGPPAGEDPLGFTREQWEAAHRTLVLSPMAFLERLLPGMRGARLGARGRGRLDRGGRAAPEPPALQRAPAGAHGGVQDAGQDRRRRRRHAQHRAAGADRHRPAVRQRGLARGGRGGGARGRARPGGSARVEELAAAAVFLCSEPASYITGTTLLVDGGLSASV